MTVKNREYQAKHERRAPREDALPDEPKVGKSLRGLWADLGIEDISDEEMKELRREMWAKFPREDIGTKD